MTRRIRLLGVGAAVLLAACAGSEDEAGTDPLQHDAALSSAILAEPGSSTHAFFAGSSAACSATPQPAPVSSARAARAAELLREAQDASLVGDAERSRALSTQAARLDPRNADVAYHLGTLNETRGDGAAATREYCRYLALSPSAPNADEVGSRILALAPSRPSASARATIASAPRAVSRRINQSRQTGSAYPVATVASRSSAPVHYPTASRELPAQPEPHRPEPRRRTREGALIGAAAGGAVGAMIGRDVKGALIGAAAGGLLGAAVGHAQRSP